MAGELQGKTIAFVATDGVEQVEYTEPRKAVEEAGATAHLVSPKPDKILVLSVAGIVADAIRAVFEDASVSEIFNDQNQL